MDYKTELIKQLEELEAENTEHPSFYDGYGFAISDAIETIKKFNYIPCCTTLPADDDLAEKLNKYIVRKSLDTESVYTETDAYIDVYKLAKMELTQPK